MTRPTVLPADPLTLPARLTRLAAWAGRNTPTQPVPQARHEQDRQKSA